MASTPACEDNECCASSTITETGFPALFERASSALASVTPEGLPIASISIAKPPGRPIFFTPRKIEAAPSRRLSACFTARRSALPDHAGDPTKDRHTRKEPLSLRSLA